MLTRRPRAEVEAKFSFDADDEAALMGLQTLAGLPLASHATAVQIDVYCDTEDRVLELVARPSACAASATSGA